MQLMSLGLNEMFHGFRGNFNQLSLEMLLLRNSMMSEMKVSLRNKLENNETRLSIAESNSL